MAARRVRGYATRRCERETSGAAMLDKPSISSKVDALDHGVNKLSESTPVRSACDCPRNKYSLLYLHCVPKKLDHQTHGGNFVKS